MNIKFMNGSKIESINNASKSIRGKSAGNFINIEPDIIYTIEQIIKESGEAEDIFQVLKATQSMSDVADIVADLDENMAKLVLKKFIYSKGEGV